jgi:tetratricopeptide (TPR) repeat protein
MSNGAEASGTGSSPTKESGAPDLLDQARRLHKQGDFESAAALYREVVAADPGRAHAWYLLGVCCQSLGHHEEAEASLRQATERQPGHPETHNQLGVVLALQDRLEEALVCFRRALALKPDDPAIGNNLGRALLRQEKDADPKQGLEGVVSVDLSPGELIDKITILEIKNERIGDPAKLRNVRTELAGLRDARARAVNSSPELASLEAALRAVNESLWEIEERIRAHEKNHDFGAAFVALARSVYRENDRRAALKRKLNDLLGARVVEEKSY